jgi:TolA-binding protein
MGQGATLGGGGEAQAGAQAMTHAMRRPGLRALLTAAISASLIALPPATARAAIDWELPPPDVRVALRPVAAALDKPPVPIPTMALPMTPEPVPALPAPRVTPPSPRPVAPLAPPRALACNPLGSLFGVASELIECGRARYQRGEFELAREAFEAAVQRSGDRFLAREARYWLGETLLQTRQPGPAEHHLGLVVRDDAAGEFAPYARHTLGWLALERMDAPRALAQFEPILRGSVPPDLIPHARHGRALAYRQLGRQAEARDEWQRLLGQSLPRAVATEATFWLGETLGQLGDHAGAVARLQVFTAGGPQPYLEAGLLRLAWWSRAAGQPLEAVKTYRGLLGAYPRTAEAAWARAGLARALLDLDDWAGAREEARQVEALDRSGRLAQPTLLELARWAAEKGQAQEAHTLHQELLGRTLDPATRAWVLLLSGETHRRAGDLAEARTRFEPVRSAPGRAAFGWYAALRLAEMDLAEREFARARAGADGLLAEALPPEMRAVALVVAAEAAYRVGEHDRAAGLYGRFLSEFPAHPQAPVALLAQGWAEVRRGRRAEARRAFGRFVEEHPQHPRLPEALLLASELAAADGDAATTQALLERLIARAPDSEYAEVATLNRAVLGLRAGRGPDALRDLSDLARRAPTSPYAGRIRLARAVALVEAGRPAEAREEFRAAAAGGEDAGGHLGVGSIAFGERQWAEAAREFAAAHQTAVGAVALAAEYGLAAVAFNERRLADFKQIATPLLSGKGDPTATPHLLRAMTTVAAAEKRWPEARGFAARLVQEHASQPATPAAIAELGAAAAADGQWPVVREAFQLLADRYPASRGNQAHQLDFAEALLRTGAPHEARQRLQGFVTAGGREAEMPRALALLAQSQEAAGDRAAAVDTYARLRREHPKARGAESAVLAQARLLERGGKGDEARPLFESALASADLELQTEAAYRLGESFRAAGQHERAVEYYMTAAYLAADSAWGRRALLGAGQSFAALRERESAVIVYKKLLAAASVEPDLAEAARGALRTLEGN